ncbi:MAG: energy-coupling factor transporter transmembrane protein EcfT [Anaerolineae bacterium]|nr:energy-coupling factor transporter transmembrane protein EcfT [Anaerolineae bacterium]
MSAVTAGFYQPGNSWLYRLDPRTRLLAAVVVVSVCLLLPRISLLAGTILLAHLILLAGGIRWRVLLETWIRLAPLLLLILLLQPLFSPPGGIEYARFGPLRITQWGLLNGLRYALRLAAVAFVMLVPVLTTPINHLVRAFEKLGLPYTWGLTIGLALRYLGAIGDLYSGIAQAQQARGWDPSGGHGPIQRAQMLVPTLVAVIIATLRLSEALALGLSARGMTLDRPRTHREDIRFGWIDGVALGAVLALAVLIVWLMG